MYYLQHTRHVHECKEAEPEVILIGDSIIQKMIYFEKFWNEVSSLHPLNLGIGGDRTQHVLWRILNGSIDQTHPRVISALFVLIIILTHCTVFCLLH